MHIRNVSRHFIITSRIDFTASRTTSVEYNSIKLHSLLFLQPATYFGPKGPSSGPYTIKTVKLLQYYSFTKRVCVLIRWSLTYVLTTVACC